jgi:nucleotide-binding universal stress UspA family protein
MRNKSTVPTRQGKRPTPLAGRKIRQILVPTDFSTAAGRALRCAAPLAKRFGAAMVLLHVVPPLTYEADYGYGPVVRRLPNAEKILSATRRLQSTSRPIRTMCRRPTCLVRTGNAAEEIVRAARDLKADLIIMGEGSMGSQAKTIAQKTAPCPVLIVREGGAELLKAGKDSL